MVIEFNNNVLRVPNATSETRDAAQYMIRHGRKQYNLCGEFCVAYTMQDEAHTDNIEDFLDYWQAKSLKFYQSLFQNGLGRTTSIYDLERMLSDYGVRVPCMRFQDILRTPLAFSTTLEHYQLIVGVKIDHYGYLVGNGIPHWEVLESIKYIDSEFGICNLYNPYTNSIRPYSWREFMNSTGSYKQGIWVERFTS